MLSELSPRRIKKAYAAGFFPMANGWGEIEWYRPDPRAILPLCGFYCSRRLARRIRQARYELTFDQDFRGVMLACADRDETWISDDIITAYCRLHADGCAHSVEIWQQGELAGGVYGVTLGGAMFAESMFHRATDASKLGLFHLVEHLRATGFKLLEVQFLTPHLRSLGAIEISDAEYVVRLRQALALDVSF